jgi:hypothetical protein
MSEIKLTEDDCRNVSWRLVEQTEDYRRYIGTGTHPVSGIEITVQKTEFLAEAGLLDANANARNETDGQRWTQGSGSDKNGVPLVKVASIPLNKFYADFASRLKEGDKDFSKWWLSQSENEAFRTRRGNI